jgi:hypothetical protein
MSKVQQKLFACLTQRGLDKDNIAQWHDMAGPLIILVLFALSFLCRGRVEFGNIYGFGLTGAIRLFLIINLMASRG